MAAGFPLQTGLAANCFNIQLLQRIGPSKKLHGWLGLPLPSQSFIYLYIYPSVHLRHCPSIHHSPVQPTNIYQYIHLFSNKNVFHIFPIILRSCLTVRSHFIPFSPNKSAMENFRRGCGHLQGIGCCAEVGLHRVQGAEELNLPWGSGIYRCDWLVNIPPISLRFMVDIWNIYNGRYINIYITD